VVKFFEQATIRNQLWIGRLHQRVELVDAEQRVLISRVTMKEFVLNETGQLAEFGNVATEKVYPVHHPQDPSSITFSGQNGFEHFAWLFCVAISACDLAELPA